jgi:hypothetical protein
VCALFDCVCIVLSVVVGGSSNGALSVFIDEAGLGNATVNYTLTWSATADYGCINGGGNHPQASNKETTSSGGATTFSETPKNGRVQVTVSVDGTPPPAPAGFSCPSGQTLVLADVSYSAKLTDTTNNVSITLTASHTFFTFKSGLLFLHKYLNIAGIIPEKAVTTRRKIWLWRLKFLWAGYAGAACGVGRVFLQFGFSRGFHINRFLFHR